MNDNDIKKILYEFREQIEFYRFSNYVYISRKLLKQVYSLIITLFKERNYFKNSSLKMVNLDEQLDTLINNAENNKLKYMTTWQKPLLDVTEGNLQAFKLIKNFINSNF